MKTIFHIGQHKTGTSALQRTLRADAQRLLEHGILYPQAGRPKLPSGGLLANHNGFVHALDTEPPNGWQPLRAVRAQLEQEIEAAQPSTVLISAEAAFGCADRPAGVLDTFDGLVPPVSRVVCYLRRPDTFLSSYHKQLIRNGEEIAGLHTDERFEALTAITQLDVERALRLYLDHYGEVTLFNYDEIDDTIDHFYRHVLDLAPPAETATYTNPSLPSVLADLARQHVIAFGRLQPNQIEPMIAHGERERVDLLGPANRARVHAFFVPQNEFLGGLVGKPVFFDDLDAMLDPPTGAITVDAANDRYRDIFTELVTPLSVAQIRRHCLELQRRGHHDAAAELFRVHARHLEAEDVDWFRRDLEATTKGDFTIDDNQYVDTRSLVTTALAPPEGHSWRQLAARGVHAGKQQGYRAINRTRQAVRRWRRTANR